MDKVPFKPQAYQKVALVLESMEEPVEKIYKEKGKEGLLAIPGVGEGIAKAIEEYIKTGTIKIYQQYKTRLPMDLDELTRVEGLGAKKAKVLYQKLGIKNIKDLEKAAKAHKIAPLFGFGDKTEKNILQGIDFVKRDKGRFLLGEILPIAREIIQKLEGLKEVKKISLAGSTRRRKETIGDVDILAVSDKPAKVMDFFCSLPGIERIWGKGATKSSVRTRAGFDIDLRVVPEKSYGSALQYFTGSKEHNIATRIIAINKGLKLNEYGIFRGPKMIAGATEEDVYRAIGLPVIPPEIREDQGEIQAALNGRLPKLVEQNDIKGDLHSHSNWDGGEDSIEAMVKYAQSLGYEYIGISDHTKFLKIENGLDEKQLLKQKKAIEVLNKKLVPSGFRILQGCETNILADGSTDIKDEVLAQLDYVIAGVHSQLRMEREEMTQRIVTAMRNPHIDIISHPTGRLLLQREEYSADFEEILKVAKETGTILEINSSPIRLDLNATNIRRAKEMGVKMIINTDNHQKEQMRQMEYGISQARRGWAEKKDIINTEPVEKLLEYFKT